MNGEVAKVARQRCAAKFLVNYYSLGHVNCFVSIHMLSELSVFYHHHEENEASYSVWLSCSKYVDNSLFTLSE